MKDKKPSAKELALKTEAEYQQYLRDLQSAEDRKIQKAISDPAEVRRDIEKLKSYIANNSALESEDILRKARELKYNPRNLIVPALGSIQLDKSSANLSEDLEDILNKVEETQHATIPGDRYIVNPETKLYGSRSREVAKDLGTDSAGVAVGRKFGNEPRFSPDFMALLDAKTELGKLDALGIRPHEVGHAEQFMIIPEFKPTGHSFQEGHHAGKGIFEANELIREAKDLPRNQKELDEIKKQAARMGGKFQPWRRLMSVLSHIGPVGAGLGAAAALKSGDVPAAVLHGASAIDPTGISDAALEVKNRLQMSPEESNQQLKEDQYSAMPLDIANEQRMLDELEKPNRFNKLKEKVR